MQGLRAGLAGIILAMAAQPVFALELGAIHVQSRLNEPFRATIALTAGPGELNHATATLAPAEEFARQGVLYSGALSALRFTIISQSSPPTIEVTSDAPMSEPYLDFLVKFSNPAGSQVSEFTVLLRGNGSAAPATPHVSHHTHPTAASPPLPSAEETPSAPRPAQSGGVSTAAGKSTYGPVAAGLTLWRVASKVRAAYPDVDLSTEQVMLGLFRANPDAFEGGKITGLRRGSTLQIPPVNEMTAVPAEVAKANIQELRHPGRLRPKTGTVGKETIETPVGHPPSTAPPSEMPRPVPPSAAAQPLPPPTAAAAARSAAKPAATTTAAAAAVAAASVAKAGAPASSTVAAAAPSAPSSAALGAASAAAAATSASQAAAASSFAGLASATTSGKALVPPAPGALKRTQNEGIRPSIEPLITALGVLVLGLIALRLLRRPSVDGDHSKTRAPPTGDPFGVTDSATHEMRNSAPLAPRETESSASYFAEPQPPAYVVPPPAAPMAPPVAAAPPPVPPPPPIPPESTPTVAAVPPSMPPAAAVPSMAAVVPSVVTLPPVAAAPSKEAVDDALADADFHIEYGLYDEAVALLKRAMAKDPTQAALLEKLAEVYATVRKPAEFEQVVAQLRGRLGEREGDRITELRRLLLLPRPLPKDYEDKTVLGAPQSPIAPSVELMPPSPGGSHKFDLSDFDSPPPPPRPRPSATVTRGEPEDVPPSPPPRPRPSAIITRGEPEDVLPSPSSAAPEPAALSADELANELATKLDLARAYSDMGDNDAARALIQEVVHGPSATLRREAEELLRRLGV